MPDMGANIGKITGYVKRTPAILPDAVKIPPGYPTGMDLRGILERVERRLVAIGKSADAASKEAGKPDAIRNLRRAVKGEGPSRIGLNAATIQALANVLKTTDIWLLREEGPECVPDRGDIRQPVWAPEISWVSAGKLVVPDAPIPLDEESLNQGVWADLDPKGDWIALKVVGDSMNKVSPPDSIILVNRREKRLVPNACYVIVADEGGEATYKKYREGQWGPESTNKKHKALPKGRDPVVIGRVRKSILSM